MGKNPLVSICIPAYSRPLALDRAMESVLTQNYENLELIVSDDGGHSRSTGTRFHDARVNYFRHDSRIGMAGNWSFALDQAAGDILCLLMDDDVLLPGFVRSIVSQFQTNSNVGIVFTDHYFRKGRRTWRRKCSLPAGLYENFLAELLELRPVAVSAAGMRRRVWESLRPFPDLLTADLFFQIKTALAGYPFFYIDQPLMIYSIHEGQLSQEEWQFRNDTVRLWDSFKFEKPNLEAIRKANLAQALLGRAASALKTADLLCASDDLSRARQLNVSGPGLREVALSALSRMPTLIPAAKALHKGAKMTIRGTRKLRRS